MNSIDYEQAVASLVRKTRSGEIEWNPIASSTPLRPDIEGVPFWASVYDNTVLVYEYKFQDLNEREDIYWRHEVAIELVDPKTFQTLLFWDRTSEHRQLLRAIQERVAMRTGFFDKLIP